MIITKSHGISFWCGQRLSLWCGQWPPGVIQDCHRRSRAARRDESSPGRPGMTWKQRRLSGKYNAWDDATIPAPHVVQLSIVLNRLPTSTRRHTVAPKFLVVS